MWLLEVWNNGIVITGLLSIVLAPIVAHRKGRIWWHYLIVALACYPIAWYFLATPRTKHWKFVEDWQCQRLDKPEKGWWRIPAVPVATDETG